MNSLLLNHKTDEIDDDNLFLIRRMIFISFCMCCFNYRSFSFIHFLYYDLTFGLPVNRIWYTTGSCTSGIAIFCSTCRLKRCVSTPLLPYTSTPQGFRPVSSESPVQIPIVGYEVMEERARFTVSFCLSHTYHLHSPSELVRFDCKLRLRVIYTLKELRC